MLGWNCYDSYTLVLKETAICVVTLSLFPVHSFTFKYYVRCRFFFFDVFVVVLYQVEEVSLYLYFPECFLLCVFVFFYVW